MSENSRQSLNENLRKNSRIVIVGNMNVGKTTLFNYFCGSRTKSVNFPGSTVAVSVGTVRGLSVDLIDTPGSLSIFGSNEDEQVFRNILFAPAPHAQPSGAILVADAKNLKRSLALALQYIEYGIPLLLDLNMIDEADSRGISIDTDALAEILGIDVFTSVATEGRGLSEIKAKLEELRLPQNLVTYPPRVEEYIDLTAKLLVSKKADSKIKSVRAIAILLLTEDKGIESLLEKSFGEGTLAQLNDLADQYRRAETTPLNTTLAALYNKTAEAIVKKVQEVEPSAKNPSIEKFSRWCTTPKTGVPIAFFVACLMYLFVGSFGATYLVDAVHGQFFDGLLMPWLKNLLAPLPNEFIRDMFIDPDFGIFPMGLFLAAGLVFPVLLCFYFFFGFLEDSGYLPRLSVLLDKVFRKIGLNGKGVLPIVMGFSCITMAILTARMLDSRKQRMIATLVLILGVPCAPMFGIMFVILGRLPVSAALTILGIIVFQIFLMGFLANKLMPGKRAALLMELPPMRWPKPGKVIKNAFLRSYFFMKEAVPVFVAASIFVFVFDRLGGLSVAAKALNPVVVKLLGLPEESVTVFIKTIIRKESGIATLQHYSSKYSNLQMVVNLLMMLLLMPCINSMVVIIKEQGKKTGMLMIGAVTGYALLLGTILNHICRIFNITFM